MVSAQCQSNQCVDGYCCNSPCGSACDFCDVPGSLGACTTGPLGRAPAPACPNDFACNGVSANCVSTCSSDAGCVAARCGGDVCIPKVSALKENFNSGGFDASVWGFVDSTCSVSNGRLQASTVADSGFYGGIFSARRYDLTDSDLRVELASAGNQNLGSMQAFAQVCHFPGDDPCLSILAQGGTVYVQYGVNAIGSYTAIIGPFPFSNLRHFRMRESASTLYLDLQDDAGTYVNLGSAMTPARTSMQDVTAGFGAGTYQPEATSTTIRWDNINLP